MEAPFNNTDIIKENLKKQLEKPKEFVTNEDRREREVDVMNWRRRAIGEIFLDQVGVVMSEEEYNDYMENKAHYGNIWTFCNECRTGIKWKRPDED